MREVDLKTLRACEQAITTYKGEDRFRVRIQRKNNPGDLPHQYATMKDATLEHLAAPESWLSKLTNGGGGIFIFTVAHERRTSEPMGEIEVSIPGPYAKPMITALDEPGWNGPPVAEFVSSEEVRGTPVARPPMQGQGSTVNVPNTGTIDRYRQLRAEEESSQLATENRTLRDRLDRAERATELERLEARHREEIRDLKVSIEASRREAGAKPDNSATEFLKLVVEQGKQNMDMMREMSKQQAELQQRSEERVMKVVESIAKKEKDPLTEKLVSMAIDDGARHTKQFESMASLTNLVTQASMTLMTHQVEMAKQMQPGEEDGVMRIADKLADAFLASKTAVAPPGADKQLPPGAPPTEEEPVSAEEAQEAWGEVVEGIKGLRRADTIVPAVIVALRGSPLRDMLRKHNGDLSDVVEEQFGAWVMESPQERLAYVQRELVKVEMALVAMGLVRRSKALLKFLSELEKQAAQPPPAQQQQQQQAPRPPPPAAAAKSKSKGTPPRFTRTVAKMAEAKSPAPAKAAQEDAPAQTEIPATLERPAVPVAS